MSSVDTYLYLKGAGGNVIAANDDGGAGYNSKIVTSLAATYSTSRSGSFTMTTSYGGLLAG